MRTILFVKKYLQLGNYYEITFEIKILDENSKTAQYYSIFTDEIVENIKQDDYYLKQGDIVTVTVKNKTQTLSMQLKNFFYRVANNEEQEVWGSSTMVIGGNGVESINVAGRMSLKEYMVDLEGIMNEEIPGFVDIKKQRIPWTIYICLDTSGSMANDTLGKDANSMYASELSELGAAKRSTYNFIKNWQENIAKGDIVKVVTFNDNESEILALDDDLSIKENQIENINTTNNNSSFNILLPSLKKDINEEKSTKGDAIRNYFIIILTDGIVSEYFKQDPAATFNGTLELNHIYSLVYNLEGSVPILRSAYKAQKPHDEGRYIIRHPILNMSVISGHITMGQVNESAQKREYDSLKAFVDNNENYPNCKSANEGTNIDGKMYNLMEEVGETAMKETKVESQKFTQEKVLSLKLDNIDTEKEVKILVNGTEKDTFIINELEDNSKEYVKINGENLEIDFKKIDMKGLEAEDEVRVRYYINPSKLIEK